MEERATTAVDSHQATENQALLVSMPPAVSKPPAERQHSNTSAKRHSS